MTIDPLPFWCLAGDHRTDAAISVVTADPQYATHDHEWSWSPRSDAELVDAGYLIDDSCSHGSYYLSGDDVRVCLSCGSPVSVSEPQRRNEP